MQSIQKLKENIFSECQNYLKQIDQIESSEDLMKNYSSIVNLYEKAQFLKNLSEVEIESQDFSEENENKITQLEALNETLKKEYWEILQQKEFQMSQLFAKIKVLESNKVQEELSESNVAPILSKTPLENAFASQSGDEVNEEVENFQKESSEETEDISTVEEQIKIIQEKESEDRRRKIVEFNRTEHETLESLPLFDEFKQETAIEKKFRLGKIKGLGIVKSLFDDDFLEEKPIEKPIEKPVHNSNMAIDFMEAEKQKQDFRIDLNDKVAFTKLLFKGDEDELRSTINQLNSYKTLDEAKEYLSELYYTKEWKNVDDYAQRLWVLVENKFI